MSNPSDPPTPGSEKKNLAFNLIMFGITGLVLFVYSCTFLSHIMNGLESSLTDELLWLAMVCSVGFYGIALSQSYKAYVRTHGPSFSVGPFTILSTTILPSSSTTSVAPPTPMANSMGASRGTFVDLSSPKMHSSSSSSEAGEGNTAMYDLGMRSTMTPRQSFDVPVCPPTPDSVASNQTPMLVTPHMDLSYSNTNNNDKHHHASAQESPCPRISSSRINRYRLGGAAGRTPSKPGFEDVEKGRDDGMFGLGMGDIGRGDGEVHGFRP